jgi:hypothetical protein
MGSSQMKFFGIVFFLFILVFDTALTDLAAGAVVYQDAQGRQIGLHVANSGPTSPLGAAASAPISASLSSVIIPEVPTSTWTYGCSATSAGMIFGYYDRTGYKNMYTGPANGGVAPLTNLGQGQTPSSPIPGSCSIIATQKNFDGRIIRGHVDDYWMGVNSIGPDPWVSFGPQHTWGDCTADYMGTNQWKWDFYQSGVIDSNVDGATSFFYDENGGRLYDFVPPIQCGQPLTEGCHGMRLFAESRGYTVNENFTQLIDTIVSGGFSLSEYRNEIDHNYPVMLQVEGHTMVGVGYDTASDTIYLHDTWDNGLHSMTWGAAYQGMAQWGVTVIHLAAVPEPAAWVLLCTGLLGLVAFYRRK